MRIKSIVVFVTAAVCLLSGSFRNLEACGPNPDWFEREYTERTRHVHTYVSLTNERGWQYFRPYIEGKLLLRERRFEEAETFYLKWSNELRARGRSSILSYSATWALKSANLRRLILLAARDSAETRDSALGVCDFIDAEKYAAAQAAAAVIPGEIGSYLKIRCAKRPSYKEAVVLLEKIPEYSLLRPHLLFIAVRYASENEESRKWANHFLRDYRDHYLADDVIGWVARSYFKEKEYKKASEMYMDILLNYSEGDVTAAALESLHTIRLLSGDIWFEDEKKNEIFKCVEALYRPPVQNEGTTRLVKLLKFCDSPGHSHLKPLIPELLHEIIIAGKQPLYSKWDTGFNHPYGFELVADAQKAALRLVTEYPYHFRSFVYLARYGHKYMQSLKAEQYFEVLKSCEDPVYFGTLSKRYMQIYNRPLDLLPSGLKDWDDILKVLPLGPRMFDILSREIKVTGPTQDSRMHYIRIVEAAYKILPELSSIPMAEDEYRLYVLLYLRLCSNGMRIDSYPLARRKAEAITFNDLEKKEIELLDAVYKWRGPEKNPTPLKQLINQKDHPFKWTAGKALAMDAREKGDWELMLWASAGCDVYDAFFEAFNNIDPQRLEDLSKSTDPVYKEHKYRFFLRRTGYAVIHNQTDWLKKNRGNLVRVFAQSEHLNSMNWYVGVVDNVIQAQAAVSNAKVKKDLYEAEYQRAVATYRKDKRLFDLRFNVYLKLKELEPKLSSDYPDIHAKTLYMLGTSYFRTIDQYPFGYIFSRYNYNFGDTWYPDELIHTITRDTRGWTRAAEHFEKLVKLYPENSMADDALYWAAFARQKFRRTGLWRVNDPETKKLIQELKPLQQDIIKQLINRILTEYPDGDMVEKAKRFNTK